MSAVYNPEAEVIAEIERLELDARQIRRTGRALEGQAKAAESVPREDGDPLLPLAQGQRRFRWPLAPPEPYPVDGKACLSRRH